MEQRHVKGILFADYVRMIRGNKNVDWSRYLEPHDREFISQRVDPAGWYPMGTFERMGNAILREVAGGDVEAVRTWGRLSAVPLHQSEPRLVAPRDPVETMMRFRVLRSSFFDFEALDVHSLIEGQAEIAIHYFMGPVAEEAASMQTMGFFEGVLEASGAREVRARFRRCSWNGEPETMLDLQWSRPDAARPNE